MVNRLCVTNQEEEIASIYRLSQDQRHKACTNTWNIEPWT